MSLGNVAKQIRCCENASLDIGCIAVRDTTHTPRMGGHTRQRPDRQLGESRASPRPLLLLQLHGRDREARALESIRCGHVGSNGRLSRITLSLSLRSELRLRLVLEVVGFPDGVLSRPPDTGHRFE